MDLYPIYHNSCDAGEESRAGLEENFLRKAYPPRMIHCHYDATNQFLFMMSKEPELQVYHHV